MVLCIRLSVLRLSMLVILYKMCEVYFCLFGVNGSCVKGENDRFAAEGSHCCQNLKYENFASSNSRLRHNIAPKSVLHM